MNTRLLTSTLCAVSIIVSVTPSRAEAALPDGGEIVERERDRERTPRQGGRGGADNAKAWSIAGEDSRRISAARTKAKEDPTVKALQGARDALDAQLKRAVDAAILEADPGLAGTLQKVEQARGRAKGMHDRFHSLTPDQREQFKAARMAAKNDPEVLAAREKMREARTPDARREASQAVKQATMAAMLKQNPEVGAVIERLTGTSWAGGGDKKRGGCGQRGDQPGRGQK